MSVFRDFYRKSVQNTYFFAFFAPMCPKILYNQKAYFVCPLFGGLIYCPGNGYKFLQRTGAGMVTKYCNDLRRPLLMVTKICNALQCAAWMRASSFRETRKYNGCMNYANARYRKPPRRGNGLPSISLLRLNPLVAIVVAAAPLLLRRNSLLEIIVGVRGLPLPHGKRSTNMQQRK